MLFLLADASSEVQLDQRNIRLSALHLPRLGTRITNPVHTGKRS